MAISFLLPPSLHLLSPKPTSSRFAKLTPKPITCRNRINTSHPLHKDHNYKLSWKKELQNVYPSENSSDDNDEEIFQELVDRRCVDNLRMLIVDSVQNAKAGHPGMALDMAEVGYLLYRHLLRHNPRNPRWFNRDRFVLSAGHGCLLQYACLHLAGFQSVKIDDLKRLCKLGSRTPGHPENTLTDGIEVTTGASWTRSGQCSWPCSSRSTLSARFNKPDVTIVDHRTYCIMGDGCAMEGISNEAASLAGHWKLNKLTLIYDDNNNTIDGPTDIASTEDISLRFKALGWNTITVDGTHSDMRSLKNAFLVACNETQRPTFIRVKTRIGKLSKNEGTSKAHHGIFHEDDEKQMKQKVKWDNREPFYVIPMLYREMQDQANRGEELEAEWYSKLYYYQSKYPQEAAEFKCLLYGGMLPGREHSLPTWSTSDPLDATRGYSESCLNHLAEVLPGLIGGSADLASSNKVHLHNYQDFQQPVSPWGRNIRYGVREHAMDGISNGIALHGGGLIPFAATFLTFSDYMKNSIRLSALSRAGVMYVFTHDSIGLGEDGPTHQPVEHLVGLRAIPRVLVFRPADGNETAGAYRAAVSSRDEQVPEYKEKVLPRSVTKRISVEAGSPIGWREYVGPECAIIGVEDFGTSGAYLDTFKKYGFTEENVTRTAKRLLSQDNPSIT
ncbi:hypothetical protein OROHE_008143 [Orobanche hederae]